MARKLEGMIAVATGDTSGIGSLNPNRIPDAAMGDHS